jgi:Tfp pilus assembly protein FimT
VIELVVTMAIIIVVAAMAIPTVQSVMTTFKVRGAVNAVNGAIHSARYQAIFQGCPYQLVYSAAAGTYQVQAEAYSAATNSCAAAFTNACPSGLAACPIPLSGSGTNVTLNADITLVFTPNGRVTSPQFPGGGINLTLTYGGQPPELITVSNYGNINVTP